MSSNTCDSLPSVASSANRFFSGTLISRVMGLGREVVMAAAFGTLPAVAAFWMAFRFAHLLRRLFGEGALHAAFVPHFEALRKEDPEKAAGFFQDLSMGLTLTLLVIVVIMECVLGATLLYGGVGSTASEVITLTMLLLPALIFICLYALNSSFLNCEKTYFVPSVAPAVLNFIWIITVIALWKLAPKEALEYLAMILVFAFAAQWLMTLPQVYRFLPKALLKKQKWQGREILLLVAPFCLAMVGVAATQINSALDVIFARLADSEGPALLWYAIRLQQFPLALFGVGLCGALLPPIARAIQNQDKPQYSKLLNFSFRRSFALMIPASFAIVALGFASVNLIYGRGLFSEIATTKTAICLWAYGAALLPMTLVLILAASFYAQKNYRIPTIVSLLTVFLNVVLNALFVFYFDLGAISVACATTIASCINAALLLFFLFKKQSELPSLRSLTASFAKITLSSCLALGVTIIFSHYLFFDNTLSLMMRLPLAPFPRHILPQLTIFFSSAALFVTTLFTTAFLLKAHDLLNLIPFKSNLSHSEGA